MSVDMATRTTQSTTPTPIPSRGGDVKPQIVGEAQKLKNISRSQSIGPPPPPDVKPNISQLSKSTF